MAAFAGTDRATADLGRRRPRRGDDGGHRGGPARRATHRVVPPSSSPHRCAFNQRRDRQPGLTETTPMTVPRPLPHPDLFWARVDTTSHPGGCWLWQGAVDNNGYGVLVHQGVHWRAHRAAWALTHGPLPTHVHLLHGCDNPPCCRPDPPDHRRPGTPARHPGRQRRRPDRPRSRRPVGPPLPRTGRAARLAAPTPDHSRHRRPGDETALMADLQPSDYAATLTAAKTAIRAARTRAVLAANAEMRGLSRGNLGYMRRLATACPEREIGLRVVGQLPWGTSDGARQARRPALRE